MKTTATLLFVSTVASAFLTPILSFAASQTKVVEMKSLSFEPKTLTIHPGDSVRWINKAFTNHSATADDGKAFDTGLVTKGKESKPVAFSKPGTYPYHCTVHGAAMSGVVEVKP